MRVAVFGTGGVGGYFGARLASVGVDVTFIARGVPLPEDSVAKVMALLDETTPSGTSSMQRDINAGKPSELEAWIGAVVRLGAEAGVETPVHSFLYGSLLPMELCARGEIIFPES